MRGPNVSSKVLAFMTRHPGQTFTADDIASEFRIDRDQAAKSLSYLRHREHVDSLVKGSYVYRSMPKPKPEEAPKHPTVFEYLGTLKDGRTVARGDNEKIYALEEL